MTPAEFEQTAEPHLEAAFRLASAMLGNHHEAEDVVQEAVFKAWSKIGQLREGQERFRPWFLTIVANECRSLLRARWWRVVTFADIPEPADHASAPDYAGQLDLWVAVAKLGPDDRGVLVLRYVLDLPVEEVARVLGISVGATKSRLHRAIARLRPTLAVEVPT